ncbi:hypothetical protein ACJIZ3_006076 [Penstemon smallii]|uniref:Alkyl transferase n=1 Tax=Penstemon smallii TaxID=265156 RepID=A0ABD3S6U5_9LAMI
MDKRNGNKASQLCEDLCTFIRRCILSVLTVGPVPRHIAFIMDGNRRYAKNRNLEDGAGHKLGYVALMNMLKYCYELDVKYVTIYAFSIENFKRRPEEVQSTMQLIKEKIEGMLREESLFNQYGVRVYFVGNLKLLSESVKLSAEKAMEATTHNSKVVLLVCIAYTSTDEILHAVEESCREKRAEFRKGMENSESLITVTDIEKHMYMADVPNPDVIIRTSGETRLSNFLLWQSAYTLLCSPSILWPEIGFRHLVRAVLDYQRNFAYLEQKQKQS